VILRIAVYETKENEVAAGDIVPVPGARFEETLASASPDVLREMIKGFAQRMMDADVEVRCNAGYGEVTPGRVNSRNGYRAREWDTRAGTIAGDPEAAPGHVLPGVPGAPAPGGAGAGQRGGDQRIHRVILDVEHVTGILGDQDPGERAGRAAGFEYAPQL
jgi:Transposase, Mutator family